MKFMNVITKFASQQDMINYRNGMLDKAQALLDEGKMEEYKAAIEDVNTFDAEYKGYAEQKANIAAMKGAVSVQNVLGNQTREGMVASISNSPVEDSEKAYRKAFMNFVLTGESIPVELRNADAYTTTTDVSAVIPNTILDRIVEKMETSGKILGKVTRTFFKGGVTVPTSSAKPSATWTTERGTVDSQKKTTGSITFNYYKLKCVVAVSLAVENVTLDVFERTLSSNIAEAMVKALEKSIIAGTGSANNQPAGILTETVVTGQNVDITEGSNITYSDICKAEGLLPAAYESAEWFMTKKTYFNQIVGMTDSQGQPIGRVNVGIDGKPSYNILGRLVNFVSSDDMSDFATTVSADTKVAFMFRPEDYMLNTNLNVTIKQYDDDDTDDKLTKAIMIADGKVVDKNSLVTVTVKNS